MDGPGNAFQLVVVLFPGGGTGLWRHVADALAQAAVLAAEAERAFDMLEPAIGSYGIRPR